MTSIQKQNIIDVYNIMCKLDLKDSALIKEMAEKLIDLKLLALVPDAILENMDVTEKVMLINLNTMSPEEREKEMEDAIDIEEALKEEGIV